MTIFYIQLVLVFILALFARYFARPVRLEGIQLAVPKPNRTLAVAVAVLLIIVSGLRNNIGDTIFYMHSYSITSFTWGGVDWKDDFGFNLMQALLQLISPDPQILIFVTALVTNALIVYVLYSYSRLFEVSIYVFITSGLYTVSMNGIRQFMAAAIIFAATKYLLKGSFWKYALVVLFASTIHQSALIMLPVYFVVRREAWTAATAVLVACAVIGVVAYNELSSVLFSAIENTQYGEYKEFSEGGANFIRVLVNVVPLVIAWFGRHQLREWFPNSDSIVNLSLINCIVMLISTQNWIFARFTIYFGLYQLILTTWVILMFRNKDRKLIYFALLFAYFLYYYYEQVISLHIWYGSHYLKLF